MRRRRLAVWLVSLPLMAAGSQLAHILAYRLVYPSAPVRTSELLATGHGYMGYPAYVPVALALLIAAELVGLVHTMTGAVRSRPRRPLPAWGFALLPVVAFTLQEFLERCLAGASFPWWMVLQPTFRVGIALQLPIALAAYLVARALLRAAEHAGRSLRGTAPLLRTLSIELAASTPAADHAPRLVALSDRPVRGPPRTRARGPLLIARPA